MVQEEVFGPVITVQRFSDEDEAVALGQRGRVRAGRIGVDPGSRAGDAAGQAAGLRRGLDQHAHPARRRDAARRIQALGVRQGPVDVRVRGLHPDQARDDGAGRRARRDDGEGHARRDSAATPALPRSPGRDPGDGGAPGARHPQGCEHDPARLRGPGRPRDSRGCRRQPADRLRLRHLDDQRRQQCPPGRRGHPGAGGPLHPHLLHGDPVRGLRRGLRASQSADPGRPREAFLPGQLRRRGDRERRQGGALRDRPPGDRRL